MDSIFKLKISKKKKKKNSRPDFLRHSDSHHSSQCNSRLFIFQHQTPYQNHTKDMSHSSPQVRYELIGAHTRYSSKTPQHLAPAHSPRLDCSHRDPLGVLLPALQTNHFKCSSQQRIRSPLLANRIRTSPNRYHRPRFRRTPNHN